jgi:hypothetical protein
VVRVWLGRRLLEELQPPVGRIRAGAQSTGHTRAP